MEGQMEAQLDATDSCIRRPRGRNDWPDRHKEEQGQLCLPCCARWSTATADLGGMGPLPYPQGGLTTWCQGSLMAAGVCLT